MWKWGGGGIVKCPPYNSISLLIFPVILSAPGENICVCVCVCVWPACCQVCRLGEGGDQAPRHANSGKKVCFLNLIFWYNWWIWPWLELRFPPAFVLVIPTNLATLILSQTIPIIVPPHLMHLAKSRHTNRACHGWSRCIGISMFNFILFIYSYSTVYSYLSQKPDIYRCICSFVTGLFLCGPPPLCSFLLKYVQIYVFFN